MPSNTFDSKPKSSSNISSSGTDDLIGKLYAMNLSNSQPPKVEPKLPSFPKDYSSLMASFISNSQTTNANSSSTSMQSNNNAFSPLGYDDFYNNRSVRPNVNSSIKFDSLSSYLNPPSFFNSIPPAESATTSDYFSPYLNTPSSSSNSKSINTTTPGYFSPYLNPPSSSSNSESTNSTTPSYFSPYLNSLSSLSSSSNFPTLPRYRNSLFDLLNNPDKSNSTINTPQYPPANNLLSKNTTNKNSGSSTSTPPANKPNNVVPPNKQVSFNTNSNPTASNTSQPKTNSYDFTPIRKGNVHTTTQVVPQNNPPNNPTPPQTIVYSPSGPYSSDGSVRSARAY